jgi:hypothetical protein
MVLLAGPSVYGLQLSTAVSVGTAVPGVGNVTSVERVAVNDHGSWMVLVDTDHADTTADGVVLSDGVLLWREGQAVSDPVGATVDSFGSYCLDDRGGRASHLFLDGTSGSGDDSCIAWDGELLFQEGTAAGAPQLTPGTPWKGFYRVTSNDSRQLLVMAPVDDSAIPTSTDHVLARITLSSSGTVLSEEILVKEGDLLPGQTETVASLLTLPHALSLNDAGEAMYVAGVGGFFNEDQAIYAGDTLVAQEGSPSPVPGRNWEFLITSRVDLNNCGGTLFTGSLDGDDASDDVIIKNGAVLAQEGSGLPAIGAFSFVEFGSGPVFLGENGKALWYGRWDDPDSSVDEGLFLDDQLVVQEGVSTVGGVLVDSLLGLTDGYGLSRYGDRFVFRAVLADGTDGAFLGGEGAWAGLGLGKPGTGDEIPCHTATGTLVGGQPLTLDLSRALPGSTATLIFSIVLLEAPFKGGTLIPSAEFLIFGLTVDGSGNLSLPATMPTGLPGGVPIYTQYWVSDPGGQAGYSATNGLVGTTP